MEQSMASLDRGPGTAPGPPASSSSTTLCGEGSRRRELAVRFANVKILCLNAGVKLARVTLNPRVAAKLYDKILEGVEELCELEHNFLGLLNPPPDYLRVMIEETKRIRLEELGWAG